MIARNIRELAVRLARDGKSEVGIAPANLGSLLRYRWSGFPPMDVQVAPVLLRDGEDGRQSPGAFQLDESVERERRADQPELAVRAIQFGGRRRDVGRRQSGQSEEARRVRADELGGV